jgi:CBS domain-containing protein
MLATDVMRTWFATIKPNAPLLDAVHLLLETDQRGLPVIDDDGSLVGIISEGDFLHRHELGVTGPSGFLLEWLVGRAEGHHMHEQTQGLRVDAVMTRDPVRVDETATVDDVVTRMDAHQISQVLVVRDGKLLGIVGRTQLLVALERCLSRRD